jgi:tyrosinase
MWLRRRGVTTELEGNPHNSIHGIVGGNMGGVATSPLDPIFWLHHCNIDRIWDRWIRLGRTNSSDPLWTTFPFEGQFVNPSAAGTEPYDPAVSGLLDINALGYRYVVPAGAVRPVVPSRRINLTDQKLLLKIPNTAVARLNTALEMTAPLSGAALEVIGGVQSSNIEMRAQAEASTDGPARLIAVITDIAPPKSGNALVRVFVNCDYLSPVTPPSDPHYAGMFTFFATEHAEHGSGNPSYLIDLTDAVTRLRRSQRDLGDRLSVQLMPIPVPGGPREGVEFRPAGVEVAVV